MKNDVMVSISCITFNQVNYIRDALNSFLEQKVNFCFEILVHDDASTDGTKEIVQEYATKYPDIIKPLFEAENQWVKGRRGSVIFNFPRAKGKYIALCEGDDYWTDPLKLQKQVDFLENNDEYVLCFHKTRVIYEGNPDREMWVPSIALSSDYPMQNILSSNLIQTSSVIFRNCIKEFPVGFFALPMGDWPLYILLSNLGKFYFMEDVMSVYRNHSNGVWNSKRNSERAYARDKLYLFALDHLSEEYKQIAAMCRVKNYILLIEELISEGSYRKAVSEKLFRLPDKSLRWKNNYELFRKIYSNLRRSFSFS